MKPPTLRQGETIPGRVWSETKLRIEEAWTRLGDAHLEKSPEPWRPSDAIVAALRSVRAQRARVSRGIEAAVHSSAEAVFNFVVGTEDRTLTKHPDEDREGGEAHHVDSLLRHPGEFITDRMPHPLRALNQGVQEVFIAVGGVDLNELQRQRDSEQQIHDHKA